MSDNQQTAVAKPEENRVVAYFSREANAAKLGQALAGGLALVPFQRALFTCIQRVPAIGQCSIESVWDSAIRSAQSGLLPDGTNAALVPFKGKCTFLVMRTGFAQLFYRACGGVVESSLVYENDIFEVNCGKVVKHVKAEFRQDQPRPPGACIAAYAIFTLPNGLEKHEIMTVDEIEAIHARSPARDTGPWQTDWGEMARKTVEKRGYKTVPRSPELAAALEGDTQVEIEDAPPAPPKAGPHVDGEALDVGDIPAKT